jgi:hypothetical protein
MPAFEKDPNELGCLWTKTGARGDYMTGKFGEQAIVVFRNDRKTPGSKSPDYRIMRPIKRTNVESDGNAGNNDDILF